MRPEKRATRNQKPIRLDPLDSACGQHGDLPSSSPTPTQDVSSLLRHNTERKDLNKQQRVQFLDSEPLPVEWKGRQRTRSNIAQLSPDDARSQLPVKKCTLPPYANPVPHRPDALPKRLPSSLQKQNASITSHITRPSSHPPIGFFRPPPGPSNGNVEGYARARELQRRASLMGVTGLDLSGDKYRGIDREPDPFDMPGQHWAAMGMPTSFATKEMAVRNGMMMNGDFFPTNDDGNDMIVDGFGDFDFDGVGLLGDLVGDADGFDSGMAGPVQFNQGVAGLSEAWLNVLEGTCSGSLADLGESEGWSGLYGVPTHLHQPIDTDIGEEQDYGNREETGVVEASRATAAQQVDLYPPNSIFDIPNDLAPLSETQDMNKKAPALDTEDAVSKPLPEPFSCTPSITHLPAETRGYIFYFCKADANGGVRIPEWNSEARMALEYEMQVRRYWVGGDGKTWVKDHIGGSGRVVKSWMWGY